MDILIDTNIALHFRRLDEIDWRELAGGEDCSLVVTPVLTRELERNKVHNPNMKLRQRAQDTVRWLANRLAEPDPIMIRKGVSLRFDEQEPLIDFAEHRLSREIADDHLIASALDWMGRTGARVGIASADSGFALKLRNRPIIHLVPADKWQLPDAVDAERAELRDLKRQLAREKSRKPELTVHFEGESQSMVVELEVIEPPPPLSHIRDELPPMTLQDYVALDTRIGPGPRVYQSQPFERYNEELEHYFGDYDNFLREHAEWAEREARSIEIGFVLANLGSGPASNVDVHLRFPPDLKIFDTRDAEEEPFEPIAPQRPTPMSNVVTLTHAVRLGPDTPNLRPLNEGDPVIGRNASLVDYNFRALKHECGRVLAPILVRFPSVEAVRPFEIEVTITCNEADKVSEKLTVRPETGLSSEAARANCPQVMAT